MEKSLEITCPFAPIPFKVAGKTTLVYELFIHNHDKKQFSLQSVEIRKPGPPAAVLETWDESRVKENIRFLQDFYRPAESEELLPGRIGLAFFWLTFETEAKLPASLEHKLAFVDESGERREETVAVTVQEKSALQIQPPLRGKGWLAAEAATNTTGHRRTPLYIDDHPYFAQRYAVDWLQFGPDGRLFQESPEKNENWYCYGADILAVAAGVVVGVQDGIIENVPLSEKMAVEINLQSAPGNYVMIDHGGEHYALYAHMLPGSITVQEGERVVAGQVIGRLGNSGNSDAPHLHFHIGQRKSPLGMHGLPYHLDRFERLGNVGSTDELMKKVEKGEAWQPSGVPLEIQDEYMQSNDVLNL